MRPIPGTSKSSSSARDRPAKSDRTTRRRPAWHDDVESILLAENRIRTRVRQLAGQIESDFQGLDLAVVSLLNGTVIFLGDLIRHLQVPMRLDFIGVSSYGSGTRPGRLVYTKELRMDVKGRDVLLVDDILDTGNTLFHVQKKLGELGPRSLRSCVLLDKPSRRMQPVQADYVGFVIPDVFVVGYGLDFAERYRNLPFIGVLKASLWQKGPE